MSDASSSAAPSPLPAAQAALARVVTEVEEHMSHRGWDAPVAVFALVRTAAALEADPDLAALLDEEAVAEARQDQHALTVIEQEQLPEATDLEDLLAQLAWPETVDGVALSVERVSLPPSAEEEAVSIADPQERLAFLQSHPARDDVRIVVGVLRSGEAWCAVRTRSHDRADAVVQGEAMVPGLIEALGATFA
ncbi:MAG: PPA1309 family protein [Actinomyces urogenitalis]|uniref:PPA1309 family protein n=1 Tax=Actinomyces urogenitalis TaxID=103621 RepID=UPI002A7EEEF1|nr:PPA1309 family protein [Actinomyces urogenitalis]MDY3678371.1 PPA1309 family protein [Actinomyces urogenitalis]